MDGIFPPSANEIVVQEQKKGNMKDTAHSLVCRKRTALVALCTFQNLHDLPLPLESMRPVLCDFGDRVDDDIAVSREEGDPRQLRLRVGIGVGVG